MKILAVIPARYASTRFPGKPLVQIDGKSMIRRVYENTSACRYIFKTVVATDDPRIANEITQSGGEAIISKRNHTNGTERCSEVLTMYADEHFDFVINVQCDEPYLSTALIDQLCQSLQPTTTIITLASANNDEKMLDDPHVVKVIFDKHYNALYFSRSVIPFVRDHKPQSFAFHQHIGIYAYRSDILLEISCLPPSALELCEQLEQLRWLDNKYPIQIILATHPFKGVDVPEDVNQKL